MRKIIFLIFLLFAISCSSNLQNKESKQQGVKFDAQKITSILSEEFGVTITELKIDKYKSFMFRVFGLHDYRTIEKDGLELKFGVMKDAHGSTYERFLFIPLDQIKNGKLPVGSEIFYEDRWSGEGVHFDSQGGRLESKEYLSKVVECIKF